MGPKQKLQIMSLAGTPVWTRQDFHWCSMILLGLPFIRARKATWVKIDVYNSFGEPDEDKHIFTSVFLGPSAFERCLTNLINLCERVLHTVGAY